MPPWRSRPRLMVFFGGYRYQNDPSTTTATRPILTARCLGIPVALALHDPTDRRTIELEPHLIGHAQGHGVLAEAGHGAVQSAGGYHPVTLLDRGQHLLAVALLLLLGRDQEEVENAEDRREEHHLGEQRVRAARPPAGGEGRRKGQIGSVGDVHGRSSLRRGDVLARNNVG